MSLTSEVELQKDLRQTKGNLDRSLIRWTVGLGISAALFLVFAGELWSLTFWQFGPSPTATRSGIAQARQLTAAGISVTVLIAVATIALVCFVVGYRASRKGAVLGTFTALVACATVVLTTVGVSVELEELGVEGMPWQVLLGAVLVLVTVGAFSGYAGEFVARKKPQLGLKKAIMNAGMVACALLLIVGLTGFITSRMGKGSKEDIAESFATMGNAAGWQADIYYEPESEDQENRLLAKLLYEKDKGYSYEVLHESGNCYHLYAVLPSGNTYLYNEIKLRWGDPETVAFEGQSLVSIGPPNVHVFSENKAQEMDVGKKYGGSFSERELECTQVEGPLNDYRFINELLKLTLHENPMFGTTEVSDPYEADIWTDHSKEVVGFSFLAFCTLQDRTRMSDNRVTMVFSRVGEPVLEGLNAIPSGDPSNRNQQVPLVVQQEIAAEKLPEIRSITPDSEPVDEQPVEVRVYGSNFVKDMRIKLRRKGEPEMDAKNVKFRSSSLIYFEIDLRGLETGAWDIVLEKPGSFRESEFPGAFTSLPAD